MAPIATAERGTIGGATDRMFVRRDRLTFDGLMTADNTGVCWRVIDEPVAMGRHGPACAFNDAMAIARQRIAEEADQRTGRLDLSDLGLATLPEALFALRHLRELDLGTDWSWNDQLRNRIDSQRQQLDTLSSLEAVSVAGTDLASLDWLQGLPHLQRLECRSIEVRDLQPLAGLTALRWLDCSFTQVRDLQPLAGLTALQRLDCSNT
jgi:internalin A